MRSQHATAFAYRPVPVDYGTLFGTSPGEEPIIAEVKLGEVYLFICVSLSLPVIDSLNPPPPLFAI